MIVTTGLESWAHKIVCVTRQATHLTAVHYFAVVVDFKVSLRRLRKIAIASSSGVAKSSVTSANASSTMIYAISDAIYGVDVRFYAP